MFLVISGLEFITEALGQVGYTVVFILAIIAVQFIIYGITNLCTRKRTNDMKNYPTVKETKFIKYLSKFTNRQKLIYLFFLIGLGIYNSTLLKRTGSVVLGVIDAILAFIIFVSIVLYVYTIIYKRQKERLGANNDNTITENIEPNDTEKLLDNEQKKIDK